MRQQADRNRLNMTTKLRIGEICRSRNQTELHIIIEENREGEVCVVGGWFGRLQEDCLKRVASRVSECIMTSYKAPKAPIFWTQNKQLSIRGTATNDVRAEDGIAGEGWAKAL